MQDKKVKQVPQRSKDAWNNRHGRTWTNDGEVKYLGRINEKANVFKITNKKRHRVNEKSVNV